MNKDWTDEEKFEILRMRKEETTLSKIARNFNVSRSAIAGQVHHMSKKLLDDTEVR
jgi:transposase-like protein